MNQKIIKALSGALLCSLCFGTSSCNFLDIVPVEQPDLDDATMTYNKTLGFLVTCYAGILNPCDYEIAECSADEFAQPREFGNSCQTFSYDLTTPSSGENRWSNFYRYIGQVHLFLQELKDAPVSDEDKIAWEAEANFLLAYYHFEVLRFYGPCPIVDRLMSMDTSTNQYPGRMHYDYVTDWIVKTLDEKVLTGNLIPEKRVDTEAGRVTRAIALALKAKVLLYAASPLWNGEFPMEWKNVKNGKAVETPGYGTELVSRTYQPEKWERAEAACREALDAALASGNYLFGTQPGDDQIIKSEQIPLPYIPGLAKDEGEEFKKKVLLMRYMLTLAGNKGNREFVWHVNKDNEMLYASMPKRLLQYTSGNWYSGWAALSPYLYAVEHFYTKDGTLPEIGAEKGEFTSKDQWLLSAGLPAQAQSDKDLQDADWDRSGIINLCVGREPRFYAWIGFDGGDYSSKFANGQPTLLQMRNKERQGYNPQLFNRDHSVTGFVSQKYLFPGKVQNLNGYSGMDKQVCPLIRMAELYLNLAECQAMLSSDKKSDGYAIKALENLNMVHERAGLPAITTSDLDDMKLMEWIKNERYAEFWAEGIRFYDVRRWVEGAKYLSAGKREGLNAEVVGPTFEEFNTRVKISQPYRWSERMYVAPIQRAEVDRNPQLVQAPGY